MDEQELGHALVGSVVEEVEVLFDGIIIRFDCGITLNLEYTTIDQERTC